MPGWEKFVRRLLGNPKLRVAVTGSSARLLSHEIATSMRGRALTTELLLLVQVSADLHAEATRERELAAIAEAVQETGARNAVVLGLDEDTAERIGAVDVRIVPIWRWLAMGRPS